MTAGQLRHYINQLAASGREQSSRGNFGVGAKVALSLLDVLAPPQLMDAIALGDIAAITRANGVGKKLAERIVTEFKDKPPPRGLFASNLQVNSTAPAGRPAPGARADAVSALVNLGYGQGDAMRAVAEAARELGEGAKEAQLIRAALKALAPAN